VTWLRRSVFQRPSETNGDPERVAIDKSRANKAAIDAINAGRDVPILVRQVKYLNNTVEQNHRAIGRVTRPILTSIIPRYRLRAQQH
jgi:putative transposase